MSDADCGADVAAPIPVEALPDPEMREEWDHFRGFGWSDDRIAARLGLEWRTVATWARIFAERGSPVRPSAAKRRVRVAELIEQGMAPKDVAIELGVSRHTVHDDCFKLGITRRTA